MTLFRSIRQDRARGLAAVLTALVVACGDAESSEPPSPRDDAAAAGSAGSFADASGSAGTGAVAAGAGTGGVSGTACGTGGSSAVTTYDSGYDPNCPLPPPDGLECELNEGHICTYDEPCGPTICECRGDGADSVIPPVFYCTTTGCPGTDCPVALPTSGVDRCSSEFVLCNYSQPSGQVQCACVFDPPRHETFYECTSC